MPVICLRHTENLFDTLGFSISNMVIVISVVHWSTNWWFPHRSILQFQEACTLVEYIFILLHINTRTGQNCQVKTFNICSHFKLFPPKSFNIVCVHLVCFSKWLCTCSCCTYHYLNAVIGEECTVWMVRQRRYWCEGLGHHTNKENVKKITSNLGNLCLGKWKNSNSS